MVTFASRIEKLMPSMKKAINATLKDGRERGFLIMSKENCKTRKKVLIKGDQCIGDKCSVILTTRRIKPTSFKECLGNEIISRPVGDFHTHPEDSSGFPSLADWEAFNESRLEFFCVGSIAKPFGQIVCWSKTKAGSVYSKNIDL